MDSCDILIVGAGFGQVPAIEVAQSMGLRVLVIDRDPHAPGMALADQCLQVDVTDAAGAIAAARGARVRAALTMQSDLPVPTVGMVNDALGLVGVTSGVAERCSNKILARERFAAVGVPQPAFRTARTMGEAQVACNALGFPCVIKAPDSSGSRGVVRVDEARAVEAAFVEALRYSRDARVLIECFVQGIEIGAQAFSAGGRCIAVHLHDDMVSPPPYMVPIGHAYPSSLSTRQSDVVSQVIAHAVEALGLGDGPSNVDAILTPDGRVELLEIGARIGATCLPELTSLHLGRDWVEAAITSGLGGTPDIKPRRSMPVAAYILEAPRDGIFEAWRLPREISEDPRVLEFEVTTKPGDAVSQLRKGTDRIGKVIATGTDVHEAVEVAGRFRTSLRFEVK